MEVICLRYFNVYGPNQKYDAYGNAIPIFVFRMLRGETLFIHGDGEQTRDFVHVTDVVRANILAAEVEGVSGAFNIASGTSVTGNDLVEMIIRYGKKGSIVEHTSKRPGDVLHRLADISFAQHSFGYTPSVILEEGIRNYISWATAEINK